jgi:ribosome-associated translation inhibitor RaiA
LETADLEFEFHSEVPDPHGELRAEVERRLRGLAAGHEDLIGASVVVEQPVEAETPYLYRARVVAYVRPEDVVAVEKAALPMTALRGALDAVERQVRDLRDMLRERWKQP